MEYDFWNFDKELMNEFNWFLYKINQRAYIQRRLIEEDYFPLNRDNQHDFGLQENVEYFHPTITLDDRMSYIGKTIANLDTTKHNIIGNTLISHFYGARGIHQTVVRDEDLNKCYVDFERIASNDEAYMFKIASNIEKSKKEKLPIWGTTELHTSIQASARNYCRKKYRIPNRLFNTFDVLEWVASFIKDGTFDALIECEHMKESYKALTKLPGIGEYYGFHASASTSVLPFLKYHHDQRFVAAGPGAKYLIKKMWPGIPNKLMNDSIYFLRENAKEVGLVNQVEFHPSTFNIKNNKEINIFKEDQTDLKYYGTEVLCCQFGVYLQIRSDEKACNRRKVSRANKFKG